MRTQPHNTESQVQQTKTRKVRKTRKFKASLRKTVSFRLRDLKSARQTEAAFIETLKSLCPEARLMGPYANDTYHVWEPRPGKTGRPPLTDVVRIVKSYNDLFEVV